MKITKTISVEVKGIGEKIKQARKGDSRTTKDICIELGMCPSNLFRIEKERYEACDIEVLRRIERVLNIDLGIDL
jgi:ribosome-binding protein aMBF1 (putative translation factor)